MESYELAKACAKVLSDKKASDIVIVNVGDQTVVCSYFVIATGKSTTQVRSLGDNVDEQIKKLYGLDPVRQEFNEESRLFYYLERLWDSGTNVERYED